MTATLVAAAVLIVIAVVVAVRGSSEPSSPSAVATVVPAPPATSPTPTVATDRLAASEFESDGEPVGDLYWLRDDAGADSAAWRFSEIPGGDGDLLVELRLDVTNADGTPADGATFYVSFGTSVFRLLDESGYTGHIPVTLAATAIGADEPAVCRGQLRIPRSQVGSATELAVRITRSDPGGELPLSTTAIGAAGASLTLTAPPPTATPTSGTTSPSTTAFWSNGDLIEGWYWLRDEGDDQIAVWRYAALPAGSGDITLSLEALATDREDGARGFDAPFYLSWGTVDASGTTTYAGSTAVTLANVRDPSDPVGYTCRGEVTIPRTGVPEGQPLVLRASRDDPVGGGAPFTAHVAFRATSVQFAPVP
jgi:hypothetical protein